MGDEYKNLMIHSIKEIDFDFTLLIENQRSKMINMVVVNILNGSINNSFEDIKQFLGVL